MNLKYRVLWFEDDSYVVEEEVGPEITNYLAELGFDFECEHKESGEDLDKLIVKSNKYDLILTDLNLDTPDMGEKIIGSIRDGKVLTEVLLYSSNENAINTIIQSKGKLERVSFSVGMKNLSSKVKSIIGLTIRKVQDVNNTRGLVIANVIDLEIQMENTLLNYFELLDKLKLEQDKNELKKDFCRKKKEHLDRESDVISKLDKYSLSEMIDNDLLTSFNIYQAIQRILKKHIKQINIELSKKISSGKRSLLDAKYAEITLIKKEFDNFESEIIHVRNTLAHVREEKDDQGIPFLNCINKAGVPIKFDEAKYIEIRKNLRKHFNNLETLNRKIENYLPTETIES